MSTQPKPVHEVRLGRIRAAIWVNKGEHGAIYNVTVSRLYKNKAGKWSDSASFGRDDLPLLAKVADLAHSWIYEQPTKAEAEAEAVPEQLGAANGFRVW